MSKGVTHKEVTLFSVSQDDSTCSVADVWGKKEEKKEPRYWNSESYIDKATKCAVPMEPHKLFSLHEGVKSEGLMASVNFLYCCLPTWQRLDCLNNFKDLNTAH